MKKMNMTKLAQAFRKEQCKRLLKKAQDAVNEEKIDYVARRRKLKLILGSLLGAYVGGIVGTNIGTNNGNPSTGALVGLGTGALAGLGTAHIGNKLRDYAGLDPMGQVVTVGRT